MHTNRLDAAKAGQNKYLGKPCRRCGNRIRYIYNCDCIDCGRARAARYARENRIRTTETYRDAKDAQAGGT